jgi:hypothetical protein
VTDNERAICDALLVHRERIRLLEETIVDLEARLAKLENPSAMAWTTSVQEILPTSPSGWLAL